MYILCNYFEGPGSAHAMATPSFLPRFPICTHFEIDRPARVREQNNPDRLSETAEATARRWSLWTWDRRSLRGPVLSR